jgi:hypothetical protein
MLKLQRSTANTGNPKLKSVPRGTADNVAYLEAHASKDPAKEVTLLLLGGVEAVDFRVRVAQAHARDDLTPSMWSHVAIVSDKSKAGRRSVFHIPLDGHGKLGYPPATNGVQKSSLSDYADAVRYPNICVLRVPVASKAVIDAIETFQKQRSLVDALELQLAWWRFVWGVGRPANPLFDEIGVPSAAFSRSSCPESIWQAARWWHEHPRPASFDSTSKVADLPPTAGAYHAPHCLVPPV